MIIGGMYSFKGGLEVMESQYNSEYQEILQVIEGIDSESVKTKQSREKTMLGRVLYSPVGLNAMIGRGFKPLGWKNQRVAATYSSEYYSPEYRNAIPTEGAFRDMDFVKNKVGVEVQFGKYAFMVYNVCAKMTIFHNLGFIDVGVEIVPLKGFANEMSSGVSYYEQFLWDLKARGEADIDIPVLVIGITSPAMIGHKTGRRPARVVRPVTRKRPTQK